MAILVLGKCSANFGRQILGKALEFPGKRLQKSLPECCFTLDTDFDWLRQKNKPRMANFPIENIAHERCKGLIPRALFLGEMRNISPVSFEL